MQRVLHTASLRNRFGLARCQLDVDVWSIQALRRQLTNSLITSSIVLVDRHAPLSICGTRSTNIQLDPAAVAMISCNCMVSKPTLAPSAMASAAAARCTPAIALATCLNLGSSAAVVTAVDEPCSKT